MSGYEGLSVLFIFLFFFVPGIIGAILASGKGRSAFGWFILCTAFPIAIIVIIFLKPGGPVNGKYKLCDKCKEIIKWEATVCSHCQSETQST